MAKLPEKVQKAKPSPSDADDRDEVAQEIANRIGNLVPPSQRSQVVAQMVALVSEERFSGPIPHPRHLKEYDEACPGAADRILGMAEENLQHSQELQLKALESEITDMREGRRLGFASLMALIIAATISVFLHETAAAGLFLGAGAFGVIGQFIRGRSNKLEEK